MLINKAVDNYSTKYERTNSQNNSIATKLAEVLVTIRRSLNEAPIAKLALQASLDLLQR